MPLVVKCIPLKQLYRDQTSDYRIISFEPIGAYPDLEINKYGNFTISGNNLLNVQIGQECNFEIKPASNSKYPASYILVGYAGLTVNQQTIEVKPEIEFEILCRLMTKKQAKYVHKAYPNFVSLVLNGHEKELDHNKIYNVGEYRLREYIVKIKQDCKSILFYPAVFKYGITDRALIDKIINKYDTPDDFKQDIVERPYYVFGSLLGLPFDKADAIIMEKELAPKSSYERCLYAVYHVLTLNETNGDTRLEADILAKYVEELVPEAFGYFKEIIEKEEAIHYNSELGLVSLTSTYLQEQSIAKHILWRLRQYQIDLQSKAYHFEGITFGGPPVPMDWQSFTTVDGFECTDEQAKFLEYVALGYRATMLTGSAGTGKSSTLKATITMLEAHNKSYLLCAPTGIAAKRLRQLTGRTARTIHMTLLCSTIANYDYIIIDETSMVGAGLLSLLLSKADLWPRLIFIADEAQLASISCGNIVHDILKANIIPTVRLTKVFRYGIGGIATLTTDVREGRYSDSGYSFPDCHIVQLDEESGLSQIVDQYQAYLDSGYTKDDILILSPYNIGKYGSFAINKTIQAKFNDKAETPIECKKPKCGSVNFRIGDKVLYTHNDYDMAYIGYDEFGEEIIEPKSVMNGDLGYIRECRETSDGACELLVEFDNGIARISGGDLHHMLLGYSMSIHKTQGNQAKAVIVVLHESQSNLLTRNLLYVAFSRAQEQMTIFANDEVIAGALEYQENLERDTWLYDMLVGNEEVKLDDE